MGGFVEILEKERCARFGDSQAGSGEVFAGAEGSEILENGMIRL
jgi:hypothetical protein